MTEFGRDISCTTAIRSGRTVTGVRIVAEAAYRRLTTPRGMLRGGEDEANYGLDLSEFIGAQSSASTAAAFPGIIRGELLKDERIESVEVDVVETQSGASITYSIRIVGKTNEGPFELQIAVDDVSTALVGITTEDAA